MFLTPFKKRKKSDHFQNLNIISNRKLKFLIFLLLAVFVSSFSVL